MITFITSTNIYSYYISIFKFSITSFSVLEKHSDNTSLLDVQIETGKTHQIRAQLAKNSMVIKGDVKYGAKRSDSIPGIRLVSRTIKTPVPSSKEINHVLNELPDLLINMKEG